MAGILTLLMNRMEKKAHWHISLNFLHRGYIGIPHFLIDTPKT
jgi:hypothetical protein